MAIYTRYGTQVTIVGKSDLEGWTIISYDDGSTREVGIMDLKADNGAVEINEAIAALETPETVDIPQETIHISYPQYKYELQVLVVIGGVRSWEYWDCDNWLSSLLILPRNPDSYISKSYRKWRIVRTTDKVIIAQKYQVQA